MRCTISQTCENESKGNSMLISQRHAFNKFHIDKRKAHITSSAKILEMSNTQTRRITYISFQFLFVMTSNVILFIICLNSNVNGRSSHLVSGSVYVDEMDKAWKVFQVREHKQSRRLAGKNWKQESSPECKSRRLQPIIRSYTCIPILHSFCITEFNNKLIFHSPLVQILPLHGS